MSGHACGTHRRLDAPQHTIPIPHSPLPVVDLRQPRVDGLALPPLRTTRNRRNASLHARRHLRRCRRARRVRRQRLDVLRLFTRSLEPRNQIQALHEREVLHLSSRAAFGRQLRVQFLSRAIVFRNRRLALLPREEDAAEVDGLLGREESRRGGERDRDLGWQGEVKKACLGQAEIDRRGRGRVGGSGGYDGTAGSY